MSAYRVATDNALNDCLCGEKVMVDKRVPEDVGHAAQGQGHEEVNVDSNSLLTPQVSV